ncbi:hypothetical protein [Brunnivagina elsteri]|uniref:Uncharacterized protein n=1 Tax=Brunnivagina elsteri CCALA 953 TaxID=987040 RepID=A0A2A2TI00_9CYAN|nr:hypothetical protein [Calothrix elsteri]PAX53362.1 hypothetical protein CK510_14380 [Calothrix elsteri CCALA 953]
MSEKRGKPKKTVNGLLGEMNTLNNDNQEINKSTNLSSRYEMNFISEKRVKPQPTGKPKKTVNG